MKMSNGRIFLSSVALATLLVSGAAYAQTSESHIQQNRTPGMADDSWETGEYGPRVRVQPGDVVEDGEVVGRDPDPNIRSQLRREVPPGGDEY